MTNLVCYDYSTAFISNYLVSLEIAWSICYWDFIFALDCFI